MIRSVKLSLFALSLFFARNAAAGDPPVVIVTVKSLDEILNDARRISGGAGSSQPSPLDFFLSQIGGGKGLPGVDSSKPIGLCVTPRGGPEPLATLLVPVKDAKAFLLLLGVGDSGSQSVESRTFAAQLFGRPVYARASGGYCALSNEREGAEKAPSPSCLSGGPFDLTLQCNLGQLSEARRKELVATMLAGVESAESQAVGLAQQARGGANAFALGREFANELRRSQLQRALEEGEKFLVGLTFDSTSGIIALDWEATARAGTSLAREYSAFSKAVPAFGGLFSNDAPLSISCSVPMLAGLLDLLRQNFGQGYEVAQAEVEKSPVFTTTAERENARDSLSALSQAFEGLKELNFAFLLTATNAGKPQVVVAVKVASGKELSNAFARWAKFPPTAFEPGEFKLSVAQHSGVPIHRLTIPQSVGPPFGGTAIHMAVRGDSAFFVLGEDSLAAARSALERTATSGQRRPPVSVRVVPSKLIALFPQQPNNAEELLKAFRGSGDYATYEMLPVPNGARGRLTLGEGFLRAITAGIARRGAK